MAESDDEEPSIIDIDDAHEGMFTVPGERHAADEELEDSLSGSSDIDDSGQSDSEHDESQQPSTNMITPTEGQAEDVSTTLKKSREDDIQKGQAVKAQLVRSNPFRLYILTWISQQLWDTLLDTRIRLHKSAIAANRFPAVSSITPHMISNHFHPAPSCRRIFTIVRLSKRCYRIS